MLDVDLGGHDSDDLTRLDVSWPSSALQPMTLIDTPGLESIDDRNSMRTRDFLAADTDRASDADAVIYLMRHLHRRDAEFLDAFLDRAVAGTSPVNAVAVLSRADEIGAGRIDAMESARRIAARYRSDPAVRGLCTTVIPIAGLLAETGHTLREDEAAALRVIATSEIDVLEPMLWSTDGFCDPASSAVTVELRRSLLLRLGMFGLRMVLAEIRAGRARTAADIAALLVEISGVAELRAFIDEVFLPRSDVLKARATLASLRSVALRLEATDPDRARQLDTEVERVESTTPAFAELRLVHLVRSGLAQFDDDENDELGRLTAPMEGRVQMDGRTSLAGIERWRTRASNPLNDSVTTEACEAMARLYEERYVAERSGGDASWDAGPSIG